jgi:hypothetical protein
VDELHGHRRFPHRRGYTLGGTEPLSLAEKTPGWLVSEERFPIARPMGRG